MRLRRILIIFEFGPEAGEWMMPELDAALRSRDRGIEVKYFTGLLKRYVEGGTNLARVLNLLFMYIALPVVLVLLRPDVVLARTTPPGIQIWAALLCRILRIDVGCWLMDYHPEIEAVKFARVLGFKWVADILRTIDAFALARMQFIIVLDRAMETRVRQRVSSVDIICHPTWAKTPITLVTGGENQTCCSHESGSLMTLVYAGNLGRSHPTGVLEKVLIRLTGHRSVQLVAIGASAKGEVRFRSLADRTGVELVCLSRVPFEGLAGIFCEYNAQIGIVLLSDETAGLVSPSKFSAYINHGLPVLYLGPEGTSADEVCDVFHAGFALRSMASEEDIDSTAKLLESPIALRAAAYNTAQAKSYFASRNGDTLAKRLSPYLLQRR